MEQMKMPTHTEANCVIISESPGTKKWLGHDIRLQVDSIWSVTKAERFFCLFFFSFQYMYLEETA